MPRMLSRRFTAATKIWDYLLSGWRGRSPNRRDRDIRTQLNLSILESREVPATMQGYVWLDLDQDGIREAGEPGIPGGTLGSLGDDAIYRTTTADSTGFYIFANVPDQTYQNTGGGGSGLSSGSYYTTDFVWIPNMSGGGTATYDYGIYSPVYVRDDESTTNAGASVGINVASNDFGVANITVGSAGNGTLTVSGTTVTYQPNSGFSGKDKFTYTGTDGFGHSANATVYVTVKEPLPDTVIDTGCECDCPDEPGDEIDTAGGSGTADAGEQESEDPVRYGNGITQLASNDLSSSAFGSTWGLTRSWTNDAGAGDPNGLFGSGVTVTQLLWLATDGSTVAVVSNGVTNRSFTPTGGGCIRSHLGSSP